MLHTLLMSFSPLLCHAARAMPMRQRAMPRVRAARALLRAMRAILLMRRDATAWYDGAPCWRRDMRYARRLMPLSCLYYFDVSCLRLIFYAPFMLIFWWLFDDAYADALIMLMPRRYCCRMPDDQDAAFRYACLMRAIFRCLICLAIFYDHFRHISQNRLDITWLNIGIDYVRISSVIVDRYACHWLTLYCRQYISHTIRRYWSFLSLASTISFSHNRQYAIGWLSFSIHIEYIVDYEDTLVLYFH